jgi:hypothetical protein
MLKTHRGKEVLGESLGVSDGLFCVCFFHKTAVHVSALSRACFLFFFSSGGAREEKKTKSSTSGGAREENP